MLSIEIVYAFRMNTPTEYGKQAANVMQAEAQRYAEWYSKPEDVSAAATGILIEAIHILNPTLDRERLMRLILGENE